MKNCNYYFLVSILVVISSVISFTLSFSEEAKKFLIEIETVPKGVEVWLNEEKAGTTPFKTNLFPETYNVYLKKEGYKTYTLEISSTTNVWIRMLPTNSHFRFLKVIKTGIHPKDIIFSPDDRYIYITLLGDVKLQIYDTVTGELKDIYIPKDRWAYCGLVEGVFTPDGKEFWFTQMATQGYIFVVDTKTFEIKTNFPSRGNWTKVGEFTPDGEYYYVSHWKSHDVTYFRVEDYKYMGRVTNCGEAPRGVGFSKDGRYLYVVSYDSGDIYKYDRFNNHKVVKKIHTGGTNGRFRVDYNRNLAFINNMRFGCFFVYDLNEDKIIRVVKTWINPNNLKLSPKGRYIYISNRGPNNPKGYLYRSPQNGRIQIFDSYNDYQKVEEIEVGNQPIGIAINSTHSILAICNYMDDTVEIFTNESLKE